MTPLASTAVRAAAVAIVLWLLAQLAATVLLCQPHHAWQRVQADPAASVLTQGERIARAGDAIFVCETPHHTGPLVWHLDLECYCAPAAITATQLATAVGGSCTVDKIAPSRSDDWGACRYSRCSRSVD
jgi:hypothetical protein